MFEECRALLPVGGKCSEAHRNGEHSWKATSSPSCPSTGIQGDMRQRKGEGGPAQARAKCPFIATHLKCV